MFCCRYFPRRIVTLVLCCCVTQTAVAEVIRGGVVDQAGKPLPDVKIEAIFVRDHKDVVVKTTADKEGNFSLPLEPSVTVVDSLLFRLLGYDPQTLTDLSTRQETVIHPVMHRQNDIPQSIAYAKEFRRIAPFEAAARHLLRSTGDSADSAAVKTEIRRELRVRSLLPSRQLTEIPTGREADFEARRNQLFELCDVRTKGIGYSRWISAYRSRSGKEAAAYVEFDGANGRFVSYPDTEDPRFGLYREITIKPNGDGHSLEGTWAQGRRSGFIRFQLSEKSFTGDWGDDLKEGPIGSWNGTRLENDQE